MTNSDYTLLLKQLQGLIESETDPIANAANISSLLFHSLESVNWVGFYFLRNEELVLGPFCGQPACTRIPVGKGVCGTAFADKTIQVVADVHAFPGHIACDTASNSEIVVPFYHNDLSGVLDVDSPDKARFSDIDKQFFDAVVTAYVERLSA